MKQNGATEKAANSSQDLHGSDEKQIRNLDRILFYQNKYSAPLKNQSAEPILVLQQFQPLSGENESNIEFDIQNSSNVRSTQNKLTDEKEFER